MQAQVMEEILRAINDVVTSVPKIALASLILLMAFVMIRFVNRLIGWLVKTGRLEEYLREIFPDGMRVPLKVLFSSIADSLILIAASSGVIRVFAPEGTQLHSQAIDYLARIGSIVILALISTVLVDALVKSMRFEKKAETFFIMLVSLIVAILVIDLANLSSEIKLALSTGLAIGLGLLIGVFSAWAFFGEYLEGRVRQLDSRGN
ncbi:MAG: hypothetical protein QXJ48_02955 [Candidatus Korarchaeum sp.]